MRTYNLRLTAYNKIDPANKTAFSNVPLTVYHKCYNMILTKDLPGLYKEYPLKQSSDKLTIDRFTSDTECLVDLTF